MATGNFDFYVLALSWSAGFCEVSGGGKSHASRGQPRLRRAWPVAQYEHGYPSNCGYAPAPSRLALDRAKASIPTKGWRATNGASMKLHGLSAGDYFDSVARARAGVVIREFCESSFGSKSRDDGHRARVSGRQSRLRPGMLSVGCQRGVLEEVRICLTKDLRDFRACPEWRGAAAARARSVCRRPIDRDQG